VRSDHVVEARQIDCGHDQQAPRGAS
jgi:hypothetical protein